MWSNTLLHKFSSLSPLYIARHLGNVCSDLLKCVNIHRNAIYKAKNYSNELESEYLV